MKLSILIAMLSFMYISYCNPNNLENDYKSSLVLYVSNQCFEIDPVDIIVNINNKQFIGEDFFVQNQHGWKKFIVKLPKGKHEILIQSKNHDTMLIDEIEIRGNNLWALINFVCPSEQNTGFLQKKFIFYTSETQIYLM